MKHRGSPKRPSDSRRSARPPAGTRASKRRTAAPRPRTGESRPAPIPSQPATTVVLPPECSLSQIDTLKLQLAGLSQQPLAVVIEVGELRRIDTASMQLLAAFVRDRGASAKPVRFAGDSPVFGEAVRLLGLASALRAATEPPSV